MARSLRTNRRFNPAALASIPIDPRLFSKPVRPFGFKGHDRTSALSRLGEGYCRLVRNLMFRDGMYELRPGTALFGSAAAAPIVHAQEVILSDGSHYPTRFTTTGVQIMAGSTWQAATGESWTSTVNRPFSMVGWADKAIFADDTNGLYELDYKQGHKVSRIVYLVGIHHLTTFANRVIASIDDRVQWCVRGNHLDWDGLGSGRSEERR